MVRLKQNKYVLYRVWVNGSQFHYGSIKTISPEDRITKSRKSQFHYGSIKTIIPFKGKAKLVMSQFHYGSIKTYGGLQ